MALASIGIVFGQAADIDGWNGVKWGSTKAAALKALQKLHARDCPRTDAACAAAGLVIDNYNDDGVPVRAFLIFGPKDALSIVSLVADEKREVVEKALAQLTARYGRGGLQSEYDGDQETLRTKWSWNKPHGTCVLESEEGSGVFTVTFSEKRSPAKARAIPLH